MALVHAGIAQNIQLILQPPINILCNQINKTKQEGSEHAHDRLHAQESFRPVPLFVVNTIFSFLQDSNGRC